MPSHRVRILHLSDLHERGSREAEVWRRRRVLGQAWLDNLRATLEDGPIDLVCFTGDAADWGKAEEFERTTDFFEAILKETRLSWDRFFAVPGNHDIDRKVEDKLWKRARPLVLSQPRLDASRWMVGQATSRELSRIKPERLLARQQSYRDWLRTIGRADLLPAPGLHPNLGYRQTLRLSGLPFDFHVIGLDSAWLCGSASEAGQLLLTQDQVGRLCHGTDGNPLSGFRLLLVHHPLDDLADAAEARRLLGDSVDLLLRGHLHEPEVSEWADPDRRLRQMAAGCLYEGHQADQYRNACAVIEVVLDGQGRPQRYDIRFRGWSPRGFWFDDGSLYRGSKGGRAVWEIQPAVEPPPVEPRVREVFVGRDEELQRLRDLLLLESPETRPVAICAVQGMPGVGKSYLADRFASENQVAFPGGYIRLVLDPKKPADPDTLRQELADSLKLRGTGPELVPLLHERLGHPRALLHVENVDSPAAEKGVSRFLRDFQGCAVIVTGRVHDLGWEEGWGQIPLQPFGDTLALDQLWTELKRRPASSREEREHRELVAALGYLPLAIHLAAGYLRQEGSVPGLLRKLKAHGLRAEPFHRVAETAEEAREIITASFQISLEILAQQLGDASHRIVAGLKALGHAPLTGFGRSLGAAIAGLSEEDFEELTVQAVQLSLLLPIPREERSDGAWRIHPLLAEILRQGTERAEVLQRTTEWFIVRLPGDVELRHEPEQIQRWSEVDGEHLALVNWLSLVSGQEKIRVGRGGFNYAMSQGPFRLWADFLDSALRQGSTDEESSDLLWGLCQCAIHAGELDQALEAARQHVNVGRRLGRERETALALGAVADILQARGQLDEALRIRQEEELPVYEKIGDIRERAVTLGQIADILQARGQLDKALRIRQEEELPVYKKIGDIRMRAVTLGNIADILKDRGQLDEALRIRQEDELPVYEKIGDIRSRAITLGKIADILKDRGQLDEALRIRQEEQLPVYEKIGDIRARAVTLGRIADILRVRGQFDEALRILQEEVLPVFEKIGDIRERATALGGIADILQTCGQLDEALRIRQDEELPVYEKIGDIRSRLVAWANMALIHLERGENGDRERANELLCKALADADRLRIPEAETIRGILQRNGLTCE